MNDFSENTKEILRKNFLFDDDVEEMIKKKSYQNSLRLYERNGYVLTDNMKRFLHYFCNKKINFMAQASKEVKSKEDKINFKTKDVLNACPKYSIEIEEVTFGMKNITPFGLVYSEYMHIFSNEKDWTFAAFDYLVILFGYTQFEALNNILLNEEIMRFDFHPESNKKGITPTWL